jgi:hypothetical protein
MAKKIYGKPWKKREINYIIGEESYFFSNVWFYKGLSIGYDKAGQITGILIGTGPYKP